MKKSLLIILPLLFMAIAARTFAQTAPQTDLLNKKGPKMSKTYIKDPGFGSRLNFGLTVAPTFNWMYDHTPGYSKNGVVMGLRYGINLNINLTDRKNYYFSTGLFLEHCGGKMRFFDNIPIGTIGISDSTATQRTYRSLYLTIPTGITLKTNSIDNFFICGNLGLLHSVNLKATNADSYTLSNFATGTDELWTREKVASQEASFFKEALYLGTGFEYSITQNMRCGLMVNYVHGFTNYFKGAGKAQNSFSKVDQKANLGYVEVALNINFF